MIRSYHYDHWSVKTHIEDLDDTCNRRISHARERTTFQPKKVVEK